MPPPSAAVSPFIDGHQHDNTPSTKAALEPGLSESQAIPVDSKIGGMPTFEDKYEERKYLKGRLAAAFRIFGKYGFDEGVAGHITCRVCDRLHASRGSLQSIC